MTAGRGIVHSERVTDEERGHSRRLHGLQLWVALPPELESCESAFQHVSAADLPTLEQNEGVNITVLLGEAFGVRSPVRTASPTLYLDVQLAANSTWTLPPLAAEMAIYSPGHSLQVNDEVLAAQEMAVLPTQSGTTLCAGPLGARLVVIGGVPLQRPVRMWWNFMATDRDRIAEAAKRWKDGEFTPIPGETGCVKAPNWVD